jgi:NADPH-dependent curcumin reductase CurA
LQEYQKIGGDADAYHGIKNWRQILLRELKIQGYVKPNMPPEVVTHTDKELKQFVRDGKLKSE